VVDGRIVSAGAEFASRNPELPPVSPDWSPVNHSGGYCNSHRVEHANTADRRDPDHAARHAHWVMGPDGRAWQTGCGCGI
jgi:hypothetical protein